MKQRLKCSDLTCGKMPYLPVYKSTLHFLMAKKAISLLNVHGIVILYSLISRTVDTQKTQGLKRLIVLWFRSCCIQLFRESLSRIKCTRQSRKVIWDMINTLFLMTVAVEPTFVTFLQHLQTYISGLPYDSFKFL